MSGSSPPQAARCLRFAVWAALLLSWTVCVSFAQAALDAAPIDANESPAAPDPAALEEHSPPAEPPPARPARKAVPRPDQAPVLVAPPPPDAAVAVAAPAKEPRAGVPVRLRDRTVFLLFRAQGTLSPEDRARAATVALERESEAGEEHEVRVEERPGVAVVYAGSAPVVQLYPDDAAAAGDSSLTVHAASVSARVKESLRTERRRRVLASTVFSASLLVFSALMALLLLRKATELIDRGRGWVTKHPQRIPAMRVLSLDLVRPPAVRAALTVSLGLARFLVQLGIAYLWLLFALSLFEATRDLGTRMTAFVLSPISALVGRVGSAVPMVLVGLVAAVAVVVLLRFVTLFFDAVSRGDATVNVVPRDLAQPAGFLVRGALLVGALLLASPLITGNEDGSLSRVGVAALVMLALSCAPVVAGVMAGVPILFGRRVRIGDHIERNGRAGLVTAVTLTEVRLIDEHGAELRLPHLAGLFSPTRVSAQTAPSSVIVIVASDARHADVRALLLARALKLAPTAKVDLLRLDAAGAHYRITAPVRLGPDNADLATALADALVEAGVPLGKGAPE